MLVVETGEGACLRTGLGFTLRHDAIERTCHEPVDLKNEMYVPDGNLPTSVANFGDV